MERSYFDFETDRRGTGSMKWDGKGDSADVIQLWVADMDFRTAPAVIDAVSRKAESGIYGYVNVGDGYYDALVRWFKERHGWVINRERVIYTPGVVPALSAIIKALTRPGEGVILQTPAYNCFFSSVRNNGCKILENKLIREETSTGFIYRMDYDDLERLASLPETRLLILCNPQNPTGRIWRRDELEKVRDICRRHDVSVVSDEIHCELVHPEAGSYNPYANVDDKAIVCCSPSKAFNTAGLQIANIISPDPDTQAKIDRAVNDNEVCDVNPFGVVGLEAAYNHGGDWLDSLNLYLADNYRMLRETFATRLPKLRVCDSEGTYLSWVDVSPLGLTGDEASSILLEKAKVRVSSGAIYGGADYIRINYACPAARLKRALDAICTALS